MTSTFLHSGKLGDLIYSLPAIRHFGGGTLYIRPEAVPGFTEANVRSAIPLLEALPYIASARQWSGEPFQHNLDGFREMNPGGTNLVECHLRALGVHGVDHASPWLSVAGATDGPPVVVARSLQRRGEPHFWPTAYRAIRSEAGFVGTAEEHRAFVREVGPIPYLPTDDLLALAGVIAGARLFVGNQSCAYAICEGLKKPAIQEVDPEAPNCLFDRPDVLAVRTLDDVLEIEAFAARFGVRPPPAPSPSTLPRLPRIVNHPTRGMLGPERTKGVSVVVLTYNSLRTIDACLGSVLASLRPDDELIVVDNASQDGTRGFLQTRYGADPRVRLLFNGENEGYSRGGNLGLRASSGRFLCLLNPDTVVAPGWLDALAAPLADPRIGMSGPISGCVAGDQFLGHYLGARNYARIEDAIRDVQSQARGRWIETKLLIGFCLMVRRETLQEIGLLDESLFLGSDDLELSLRVRSHGLSLCVVPEAYVDHVGGVSFSSLAQDRKRRLVFEGTERLLEIVRNAFGYLPDPVELWGLDMIHK
ncbi:MAG: glycosyltransferase [Fimbriimonas sp.]